jgi:hypothetical protein
VAHFTPVENRFGRPATSDNPSALLAWQETGVTFTPDEVVIIAALSDQTTLEGCVAMGAQKRMARLWAHQEASHADKWVGPKWWDYTREITVKKVDDFEEAIAVFPMIVITSEDGTIRHPCCQFSYWDDGCILQSEGALFGLMDAEHYQKLRPAA